MLEFTISILKEMNKKKGSKDGSYTAGQFYIRCGIVACYSVSDLVFSKGTDYETDEV